jgi:hypothetical protein
MDILSPKIRADCTLQYRGLDHARRRAITRKMHELAGPTQGHFQARVAVHHAQLRLRASRAMQLLPPRE